MHINLKSYGQKIILPSESIIVDYRGMTKKNLTMKIICPAGVLEAKFKDVKSADEFVGQLVGSNSNIVENELPEGEEVKIEKIKPTVLVK